jgi:glycosyltransferase involved in cell wall biosynthesis
MRVLHLNTHSSGGSYEYAALLCAALAEQGIESHLLSKNSQLPEAGRPLLDRVIRRSYVSLSTEPWHGTRRLLSPPAPEQLDQVDVVHLHMVADWFDVPHLLETLPRRMGVVISIHDMWHITGGCFLYRGCDRYTAEIGPCDSCPILRWPANRLLARAAYSRKLRAYRNCGARMVANSHWLSELAGRSAIAKACGGVRVIPSGIDTAVFRAQDRAECRAELAIPQNAFVIAAGAASLTDRNKNIQWLLEQLELLELDNVLVLLAGEGALRTPVGLNVRSIGGVPDRAKRAKIFGAADIFVSASLMETYGLTLIEAMSCGTPVVAFRTGGVPEAVPDGKAGILCEILDAAGFKNAIERLRARKELRHELGNTATKLVATRNSKGLFGASFARLYRECFYVPKTVSAEPSALAT